MTFVTKHSNEAVNQAKCHRCEKMKPVSDGFYVSKEWKHVFCGQCAASVAEAQLNKYYQRKSPFDKHQPLSYVCAYMM